jgi:hypothetical protein
MSVMSQPLTRGRASFHQSVAHGHIADADDEEDNRKRQKEHVEDRHDPMVRPGPVKKASRVHKEFIKAAATVPAHA